jgi:hypothetical protein
MRIRYERKRPSPCGPDEAYELPVIARFLRIRAEQRV